MISRRSGEVALESISLIDYERPLSIQNPVFA